MTLNPNTRTKRIEMLANPAEVALLDQVRGQLDRSTYLRGRVYAAAQAHGMAPPPPRESRGCPGNHRMAGRGSASLSQRRHL